METIAGIGDYISGGEALSGGHVAQHAAVPSPRYAAPPSSGLSDIMAMFEPIGKAFGQYQTAQSQADIMRANADFLRQQAHDRRVFASMESARADKRRRAVIAQQIARTADAGALAGTNVDAIMANSAEMRLDAITTEYNENYAATQQETQADIMRSQAQRVGSSAYRYVLGGLSEGLSVGVERGFFNPFSDPF